ncbi:MAG: universal stress protein [Syntrophomonadaceae bacterium]|nr:universal stress protein [Syntrophomonadaceae bacterium]
MSKKIMVALDNSDYADKVMTQAVELTGLYNTRLHGLAVIDDAYWADMDEPFASQTRDFWTTAYSDVLARCAKLAEGADIYFDQEIVHGNPAEQIIARAEKEGIELIVLGHLGKTAAQGFQIGSVAQKVAAFAKCSVFIVK